VSMSLFDLEYDANWLGPRVPVGFRWPVERPGVRTVADGFPYERQLHMLVHPDWWGEAFVTEEIAA
jgi:hypothetical protein